MGEAVVPEDGCLFPQKVSIRCFYPHSNVPVCKAEKEEPSQRNRRSCAGGSPLLAKASEHPYPASLSCCHHVFGQGPEKRQAGNPEDRLRPSLPVLLASSCSNSP